MNILEITQQRARGLNTAKISNAYSDNLARPKYHFGSTKTPTAPNYSAKENWILLLEDTSKFTVDLIWLYPTTFVNNK